MDQMELRLELRSGKTLVERNVKEDSDNDPEENVQNMLDEYAVGGIEEGERTHTRRTRIVNITNPQPPPPSAMDISKVRYPPTSAMASAGQTSTRGPSWPEPPRSGRFNIGVFVFSWF